MDTTGKKEIEQSLPVPRRPRPKFMTNSFIEMDDEQAEMFI